VWLVVRLSFGKMPIGRNGLMPELSHVLLTAQILS
jgi:hypothetical protein